MLQNTTKHALTHTGWDCFVTEGG